MDKSARVGFAVKTLDENYRKQPSEKNKEVEKGVILFYFFIFFELVLPALPFDVENQVAECQIAERHVGENKDDEQTYCRLFNKMLIPLYCSTYLVHIDQYQKEQPGANPTTSEFTTTTPTL
jgi:hypothetical protein